jgi:hypothetical protein
VTRPMVLRAVTWSGDGFGSWEFTAVSPAPYRRTSDGQLRYQVTGTLRHSPDSPPDLELVTVTNVETRGVVEVRGESTTLRAPTASTLAGVTELWRDGRYLAGPAPKVGRPSERDMRVADYRRAVQALREAGWGPEPTIGKVLEYLGEHHRDEAQVRRDIGMRWRDWLRTID